MTATAIKHIKGQKYLYFTYYDGEKKGKREVYCGPEGNPKSMKKARKLEKEYLIQQKRQLKSKIDKLDDRIRQLA